MIFIIKSLKICGEKWKKTQEWKLAAGCEIDLDEDTIDQELATIWNQTRPMILGRFFDYSEVTGFIDIQDNERLRDEAIDAFNHLREWGFEQRKIASKRPTLPTKQDQERYEPNIPDEKVGQDGPQTDDVDQVHSDQKEVETDQKCPPEEEIGGQIITNGNDQAIDKGREQDVTEVIEVTSDQANEEKVPRDVLP